MDWSPPKELPPYNHHTQTGLPHSATASGSLRNMSPLNPSWNSSYRPSQFSSNPFGGGGGGAGGRISSSAGLGRRVFSSSSSSSVIGPGSGTGQSRIYRGRTGLSTSSTVPFLNRPTSPNGNRDGDGSDRPLKRQMVYDEATGFVSLDTMLREREKVREEEREMVREGEVLGIPGFGRVGEGMSLGRSSSVVSMRDAAMGSVREGSVGGGAGEVGVGGAGGKKEHAERILRVLESINGDFGVTGGGEVEGEDVKKRGRKVSDPFLRLGGFSVSFTRRDGAVLSGSRD